MTDTELAAYVDAAARVVGLPIRPEHRDGVIEAMRGLMVQVAIVQAIDMPEQLEAAPVFTP